jgi:transglutaminase-like putative cysteine protease
MKFNIEHQTRFEFNKPIGYTIQQLRLTPENGFGQRVSNWQITVSGVSTPHIDTFGNTTHTLVMDTPHQEIIIKVTGEVETDVDLSASSNPSNRFSVSNYEDLALPVYLRDTQLTEVNDQIIQFSNQFLTKSHTVNQDMLMRLMSGISKNIVYDKACAEHQQSAITTLTEGIGLSQGLAHLFISCCRAFKIPARLVHGYCYNHVSQQLEYHSWADAWLLDNGWQSFDVANNARSNGIHVRLATGLDYRDACPVAYVMHDTVDEKMSVNSKVQAIAQQ